MRINQKDYPTEGHFSGDELDFETHERILNAMKSYTLLVRIFGTFMTTGMVLSVFAGIQSVPEQLQSWQDSGGYIIPVAYFTIGMQFVLQIAFTVLMFRFFLMGHTMVKRIQDKNFTYSIGRVTDKCSYYGKKSRHETIYVDDIPCSDIAHAYDDVRLGTQCYILYVKKGRYCFPL